MDSVKDHLVPQVLEKKTTRKIFKTLKKLFEHNGINVTLTLRNQLSNMKMIKSKSITSYFMRIVKLPDKPRTSGDNIEEK